ncbi:MAG: polysaccharide biosynthesis tyrosine autokinase, partial [Chitinophagaceae bacterium]|nr:polysaccharide biosynthesis tyrosine autokinase [Chitinophagaceae bacterium]
IKGFPNTPASGEFKVYWTSTAAAAAGYAGALQVTPKSAGTGILNISMITNNSELGADIINELMEEYALYTIEQKREESEKTLAFINSRLLVTSGQLDSIQQAVINYRNKHNIIDGEAQTAQGFNNLSEFDKTIIEQRTELTKAEIVESYLNDRKNEFSKVPSTLWIDEPVFANLVGEYNKVQIERLALINSGAGKDNPLVLEKNIAVEKGRERVLESLKSTKKLLNDIIATATSKSQSSQQQLKAMPAIQKDLAKMEESAISITTLKNYLEQEREKTAIKIASATANSTPTDRAAPTSTPVKPNRKAIQILAFLLGLGLPALFIFISEILNDKVSTRFDIEKITNTPIVGEIGHSYSNNTLVVSKTTRSMVAEQFRIIRSNLQYILGKAEKSTILVTSSFSGEGKSYATTNMGAVLALAGKKTVILEFDIRKPKLISGLGMPKGPGITNFLVGKGNLEDLIKPVADNENLFVLGCGPVPPNPAELLLDPKMDELFEWLQARFDIILVDTAPVGMVSDAMTLSKYAQCTLYMVRQGHTFKKQIALIDEFYSSNKLPKISIIINDVKIKPGYGYYGYGRYGYGQGYGYGSYYEEETPPHNFFERIIAAIGSIFPKKKKN